ncbi:recombinase family protein [Micromonospora sp. RTP1Z1]|uniref:recombinase family protein n=1 Tax=Micromonospora sp. RTP1Z1 TaxID=2994043 RepID=UPI0029C6AB0C|nr:recombinase family protein [Micromonospora sp. RTP1Z1]
MGEPVPLRCAIYCRISQDRESEERGVTRQEEDCRELAAKLGFEVVRVYVDNDLSASTRAKKRRPGFEDMMAAAEGGHADVIVSYSNSRLTRRPLELERLITLHQNTGVFLRTLVSGDDNLSTAEGRMTARIKASIDAAEAERTGERVERAARQRREEGRLHGGARTFGYVHGSPLGYCQEIDPVAAKAIREGMERLFVTGRVSEVRKLWQRMGVRTPLGKEWQNDGNVARTLRNPRIAGLVAHDGEVVGEGKWPAIITRAEHEAILEALGTRGAKGKGGPTRARKYLLPGFVYCMCGAPMSAQVYDPPGDTKYSRYNRYVCISQRGGCGQCSRQRPWLEDAVREWVTGAIEGKLSGPAEQADDPNPAIEARIRELETEYTRVQNGHQKGIYNDDQAMDRLIPLREQIQQLRAQQGELAKEAAMISVDKDEELEDWLDDAPESLHRRREILGRYVKRIIVKPVGKRASNGWDGPPPDSVVIVPRG